MKTAGIDVGLESIKIVILDEGKVLAKNIAASGGGKRAENVEALWEKTLADANISAADVEKIVATGQGKTDVSFADRTVTEPIAAEKYAKYFCPKSTGIVDMGADQIRVVTYEDAEGETNVTLNQKCGAGIGTLLKYVTRRLDMSLEELSSITPDINKEVVVNDGCIVFAELDALELLNNGVAKEDVANALVVANSYRINAVFNDRVKPLDDSTILAGGIANNAAVVSALKQISGISFNVSEDPEFVGAAGAAVIAMTV